MLCLQNREYDQVLPRPGFKPVHSFLCPSTSPIVLQFPLCPAEGSRPHLSGCVLEEYPRVLGGICLEPWNCTEGAWVSCFSRDTRVHRSPKVQVRRMAVLGFPGGTPFFPLLGSGRKIFNELGKRRAPPPASQGAVSEKMRGPGLISHVAMRTRY